MGDGGQPGDAARADDAMFARSLEAFFARYLPPGIDSVKELFEPSGVTTFRPSSEELRACLESFTLLLATAWFLETRAPTGRDEDPKAATPATPNAGSLFEALTRVVYRPFPLRSRLDTNPEAWQPSVMLHEASELVLAYMLRAQRADAEAPSREAPPLLCAMLERVRRDPLFAVFENHDFLRRLEDIRGLTLAKTA